MQRNLSLVLDKDAKISLTLETMEAKELDKYISKNFNSKDDVRTKYKSLIDEYLKQHQRFLDEVKQKTGRDYAGSIVITELQEDLSVKRVKVLYKKDIRIFKEITNNSKFILAFENRDYINYINALKNEEQYQRIFLDYYAKELRFRNMDNNKFKRVMGQWRNAIKESYRYYEIIRTTLKEYDLRYKELKLDSPNVVYSKYLENKSLRMANKQIEDEIMSLDKLNHGDKFEQDLLMHMDDYQDEPKRYKTLVDEDEYPGDLEKLTNEVDLEDDNSIEISKTKSLHNNHYQMFTDYTK